MRLQSKLFVSIGLLLLLVALVMFFLPRYLIKRDVQQTYAEVQKLLKEDVKEIEDNQKAWLNVKLSGLVASLDEILFLVNDSDELTLALPLKDETSTWETAARMVAFNPNIGLVQVSEGDKAAVVLAKEGQLYPVKSVSVQENLTLVEIGETVYIGIEIPSHQRKEKFYALIPYDSTTEQVQELLGIVEEEKASPALERALSELRDLPFDPERIVSDEAHWADKVALLQLLAPLFADGLKFTQETEKMVPAGVARVGDNGEGEAILTADVFRTQALFDADSYFHAHLPPEGGLPVAEGSALVVDGGEIYLVNTLHLGDTYVSLGAPLNMMGKELARASQRTVILSAAGHLLWFLPSGEVVTSDETSPPKQGQELTFLGKKYTVSAFQPLSDLPVTFYVLTSQHQEEVVLKALTSLYGGLARKLSVQMFVVMLVSLAIALLILSRIAASFSRPIKQLAQATEGVAAGKYGEVALPDVGKRKDEVATLTRAFRAMVDGLIDREKIRGVLNKVVSKDVADEILKSTIHLGGEDRVITMLFSDIRDFTTMTENLSPQQTIEMLNTYMTKMSHVIEGEGGVIDKYVGDEIMALYGAPSPHPDHAIRALSSAMLMVETLKKWNGERASRGEKPVEMGVGVHTGLVVAGNMGAEDRLNYTVLGANVNLAARLGQAAEPMQVIISEMTLKEPKVSESFHVKPLESISLKGFTQPVKIYQIVGFKWGES